MILALPLGLASRYVYKWIHQHQWILYGLMYLIAVVGFFLEIEPIIEGELAIAVWSLVMIAGAISPINPYGKALRGIRKELSITGFILITPHALHYLLEWDLEWFGIIAFAIMIPLTIISMSRVRRLMSQRTWKNIQRLAYVVYASLALHLALVEEPLFTIVFAIYVGFKVRYELQKRNRVLKTKTVT